MKRNRYAIIVAGGKGLRMGGDVPKQFQCLQGKPILMHTIERFYQHSDALVVVLPNNYRGYWAELCRLHLFDIPHLQCDSGETRYDSVRNALELLPNSDALVAIHDAVRPMVSEELIDTCFGAVTEGIGVLPAIPMVDSLRAINSDGHSYSVSRSLYRAVQTPQCFVLSEIKYAYCSGYCDSFTDDASVYEASRIGKIILVNGDADNIKITTSKDLDLAELLLKGRNK